MVTHCPQGNTVNWRQRRQPVTAGHPLQVGQRGHPVSTKHRRYLLDNPGLLKAGLSA
jgi:hypothetical protein